MKQLRKFRPNYFFNGTLAAAMLYTLTWKTGANGVPASEFYSPLTSCADTIIPSFKSDSADIFNKNIADTTKLPGKDTNSLRQKIDTFSLKLSKDSLEAPLKYTAEDSVVIFIQDKKIFLYGKTKTEYKDIVLTAPKVELDQQTQQEKGRNA